MLYPASYDYVIRTAKYSKIWDSELEKHRNYVLKVSNDYRVVFG